MLRQTVDDAAGNIAAYREARAAAGLDGESGAVTLMMHAHLGDSDAGVRERVREPLTAYLSSYLDLLQGIADQMELSVDPRRLAGPDGEALVEHALDRYLTTNGLFGTPETALAMVHKLAVAGVDEVACLLDFGLAPADVLEGLEHIVRLQRLTREPAAEPAPAPVEVSGPRTAPLTLGQERQWFLDRLLPENPAYHVRSTVRLRGPLDTGLMERCLNEIVRRHDALRTSIVATGGTARQQVEPGATITVPVTPVAADELDARVVDAVRVPFDLSQGPLMRAELLQVAADDHVLVLTLHHVIADGWSVGVIHRELAALYAGWGADPGADAGRLLPPLGATYPDFAEWQRAELEQGELDRQLRYWLAELAGAPEVLTLPTTNPRPSVQTFTGAQHRFDLGPELAGRVQDLAQSTGSTVYMTLLAAYAVVLAAHSGQRDVVIGSPIANRARPGSEQLVGLFVNMLAMRVGLEGDPTFADLVGRVRHSSLAAHDHQECPLESVIDELQLARNLSHQPLFQVVLVMQPRLEVPELPGLAAEPFAVDSGTSKFDIVLDVTAAPDGLSGAWEYNHDLFDDGTIAGLHSDLVSVLETAVTAPDTTVEMLCRATLSRRAERERLRSVALRDRNRNKLIRRAAGGGATTGEKSR